MGKVKKQEKAKSNRLALFIAASVISVLTCLSYTSVQEAQLTNWDDNKYITENPVVKSLSTSNIRTIFTGFSEGNYHPLTMISFALNYSQNGLDPGPYHVTNLVFHLFNTLLVFWFIFLLCGEIRIAFITSLLFGVHPLHVESVAWVSGRKDLLYVFFFLLSLISYVYYSKNQKITFYFLSLFFFLFSCLSKGMAVALALVIPLLDFYLNRRVLTLKNLTGKIPFFVMALFFGLLAVKAQQVGPTLSGEADFPFFQRIAFAGYAFIHYLWKLMLPYNLAVFYPYPINVGDHLPAAYYLYPALACGLLALAIFSLKYSRDFFFGFSFFTINLIFVLQILSVGNAVMADRYTYLSSLGFFFMAGVSVNMLKATYKKTGFAAICIYSILLVFITADRCKVWQNSLSLWNDQIEKQPTVPVAFENRALVKGFANDLTGALKDFDQAIRLKPDYAQAYFDRAIAKEKLGDNQGAVSDYNMAIKHNKNLWLVYLNRGKIHTRTGEFKKAVDDFNRGLALVKDANLYFERGNSFLNINDTIPAIKDFTSAIELKPGFSLAFSNRGLIKMNQNDLAGALADFNKALESDPQLGIAYYNRGVLKFNSGKKEEACTDFRLALAKGHKEAQAIIERFCQ